MVQRLLELGADANEANFDEWTPLFYCMKAARIAGAQTMAVFEALLAAGADVAHCTSRG